LESDSFLQVITPSISAGWQYNPASSVFSYATGTPTGTLPANSSVTLTFDVRPAANVCSAGGGSIVFTPLYNDICSNEPFTANPVGLNYTYAQGEAPTLNVSKSGPSIAASGDVFTYAVNVSGLNPANIGGAVSITELLPSQFALAGPIIASAGSLSASGQSVWWNFDPPDAPTAFSETLLIPVQVVVTQTLCGASQIVVNAVQATARPTCPGCALLSASAQVDTAITNNEGVIPSRSASGVFEACGSGFAIGNSYQVTGTTTITWTGATFTEALGIDLGGGALPPGTPPLIYVPGSLSVTVDASDYTSLLAPTINPSGSLVIDLSPLQAAGAPTQNLTLHITYTVNVTEGTLGGLVERTFYDWSQFYLPNFSSVQGCASNQSFNQVVPLTIGRGDLSVGLAPHILDRCSTNSATINVVDNTPGRYTSNTVVTFTSSVAEIQSARNFTFTGSLASVGPIGIVTDTTIGDGRGLITFTLPPAADLDGDGAIRFDIDVNCSESADWDAGLTFLSLCALPHGDTTNLSHVYRAPNLTLFATPIRYTVRDKSAIWKFFVTNNGNLTATNVVITNAIYGLSVLSYTADNGAGVFTLSGTLPITGPPDAAVFTLSQLAPNEQRAVTVTAEVFLCNPLRADIVANLSCFGDTCAQPQRSIDFLTPDPYLLTNNGQTADLPMCDLGNIVFTTKNASPDVSLYQLDITETLRGLTPDYTQPFTLTILDPGGGVITTTTAFTPVVTTLATQTLLSWHAISAPFGLFDSLGPLEVVVITVPVRTSCVPPNSPQSFASASAQGPCGKQLGYTENAVTLRTLSPDLTIVKDGRGPSGAFGETIYAEPGDTVTWRVRVTNQPTERSYVAHHVVLSDTWPFNFQFITATASSPVFTMTVLTASNTITWNIGDIAVGDSLEFLITGTVATAGDSCQLQTINTSRLSYGCGDGCLTAIVPQDTAFLATGPNLQVILAPGPLQSCEGDIPITIRSLGTAAYSNTLTVDLPPGYVYSHIVGSGLTPTQIISNLNSPQFAWNTIPGTTDGTPYEFVLTLRVRNDQTAGACSLPNGLPVTATLGYDNHAVCAASGPFTASHISNLTVLAPMLSLSKLPRTQTVDVGQRITWTIRLTNTGSGIAQQLLVTDVVGSNYDAATIVAGNGSDGAPPVVAGNVITWTPGNLAAGGVWTATVSANVLPIGDNRNVVTATAGCATGCQTALVTDTAYSTLLQSFVKSPQIQTGTIGGLVVFTFSTSLPDENALYGQLTITDALPVGLGYVDGQLSASVDNDGNDGGPVALGPLAPTSQPALYAGGPVVWQLGNMSGTASIGGVITAVIQDIGTNHNGVRLTNLISMTYTDDGQPYVYTDTADVDIEEPVLHIGKSYLTSDGCGATLFNDHFNTGALIPPWSNPSGGSGWGITSGAARNNSNAGNRRVYNGDTAWTDYSVSAMLMSTDTAGDIGLIFRAQGLANDQNYYRFRWNRNGASGNYRLERVVNGAAATLGATVIGGYETNRWYHVEVRAVGSRLQVFIDGALALERTDAQWASGRVGLYANNQNAAYFDDVLVTRMDQAACTVGAGDLVTYTLTVSNQNTLPGYDLTIVDSVRSDLSLITYTFQSDDPASSVTAEPAPIPGATGALVWGVNQLTPTAPFNPLSHTALTLTLVMQVSPGITANVVLANQASLFHDNWRGGTQPTPIDRESSGGSHSTAIRTVGPALIKTVDPPTATLGSLVTYTILLPTPPITANLYAVAVGDVLDARLMLQSVDGAPDGLTTTNGSAFTVTYATIPFNEQRAITVTAVLSDPLGAVAGDVITNVATLSHTAGTTTTNTPVFTVTEPSLFIVKASNPPTSSTVGAGQVITYTVVVTNLTGATVSPAYDLFLTDTLPADVTLLAPIPLSLDVDGAPLSAPADYLLTYAGGVLTLDFTDNVNIRPGGRLTLVYRGQVDADVSGGVDQINAAEVTWSSLPGAVPGDRDYGPISDTTNVHAALPMLELRKSVQASIAGTGLPLSYTLRVTNTGIVSVTGVVMTDRVPFGATFVDATSPFGGPDANGVITWTLGTLDIGASREVTLLVTVNSSATAQIVNTGFVTSTEGITDTDTVTTPVLADLEIDKQVTPGAVARGQPFTYTARLTNTGLVTFDPLIVTDTLPAGFLYVTGSGLPSSPDTVAEPLLRWNNLGPLAPSQSLTLTFAVTASTSITGLYVNTVIAEGDTPGGVITVTDDVPVALEDPRVEVDKRLAGIDTAVAPRYVTFTIEITNTGPSLIDQLPLIDFYDPAFLSFAWAAPMPDEPADDGQLAWYDLTAPAPNGFSVDLPPGQSFLITTVFSVVQDIISTTNTAAVANVVDIFDNPANDDSDDEVINNIPTAVELLYFRVDRVSGQQVDLGWATAVEIDNFGFSLYRASTNDFGRSQWLHFEASAIGGGGFGAAYAYADTVPFEGVWWYWLADVDTQGRETLHGPLSARVGPDALLPNRLYLPIVVK
jgi:uncharacterized repeat protein (TIGR01451 family)/fimbrial isopeptide formation D2 family protein